MYDTIKRAIGFLFEPLPFSRENEECREIILLLAGQKYEEDLKKGNSPAKAAGNFLIHADTIESLGVYLGIDEVLESKGRISQWDGGCTEKDRILNHGIPNDSANVLGKEVFQKIQKKLRRNSYFLSFVLALWFNSVVALLLNLPVFLSLPLSQSLPTYGIIVAEWAVFGLWAHLVVKKRGQIVGQCRLCKAVFHCSCREIARRNCDFYTKKLANTLFCVYSVGFLLIFSVLLALASFRYSLTEVLNTVNFYLSPVFLLVYLTLKNYLCRKQYAGFFSRRKTEAYGRELRWVGVCSAAYYLCALICLLVFRNRAEHIFSFAAAAVGGYFVLAVFYNVTRRRKFVGKNIVLNVKKACCSIFIVICLASYHFMKLDLFLLQPYINTVSEVGHGENAILYNEDSGVYTIVAKEDSFRILQLTDIHLGGSIFSAFEDTKALKACYRLILETQPDLVVVTGDLVFPMGVMSFSFNNNAPIMQFANFMRNVGIPWAFTYGNHDTEALATLDRAGVDSLMKSLSYKTSKNLLYPYVQPDVYGRSNQMIEVRGSDGKLMQALFLIDSNDYVEAGGINEYDYIHDDQVEWYKRMVQNLSKREGTKVPSMVFTHIPLQEYKEANDLYEKGSGEVTYFYGTIGEKMIDKICCSKYQSKLFDTAVELGSTQAIFCGHDHYNNQSLEYKGIRLTYGYSIDYLAMPGIADDTEQRGATLVTVGKNGDYEIVPYRLVDLPPE